MVKNFSKGGFTNWGLANYGKLRSDGINEEKAVSILINSLVR